MYNNGILYLQESGAKNLEGDALSPANADINSMVVSQVINDNVGSGLEARKMKNKAKELNEKFSSLTSQASPYHIDAGDDEDKDSCSSGNSDDSDDQSWDNEREGSKSDTRSRDDGGQSGLSSRLSNISQSKSYQCSNGIRPRSRGSNIGGLHVLIYYT